MTSWWGRAFGLDVRSLALFRVGLGLFTAADAMQRILEARYYYSDFGVWPRAAAMESLGRWSWSLYFMNGTVWWQLLLLLATLAAGVALAAGFRTGVATTAAWFLTASVHTRNTLVLDGGDAVHRVLLFWAMFVPTGAAWSLDSLARQGGGGPARAPAVLSTGALALRLQMAMILVVAALLKSGDSWRRNFDAVWLALQWDVYTTGIGVWLRQFPELLRRLTQATMLVEGFVPLLLFVPYAPLQVLAILTLIGLHAGFALGMHVLMFSAAMSIGWATFAPGWFWDRIGVAAELPARWRERLPARWMAAAARQAWFDRWPRASRIFAAACLVYVVAWNIRALDPARLVRYFPAQLNPISDILRIDQDWSMFAPSPIREDGWLVIPGQFAGGRTGDLFRDGAPPVSWERPASIADTYRNRRGRKFYWAVTSARAPEARKQFARYLCRAWFDAGEEPLASLEIYLMFELTGLDHTITAPEKQLVWRQSCQ